MYEYNVSYFPINYFIEERNEPLAGFSFPTDPDPESLYEDPIFLSHLQQMGNDNWELTSVTPLLRGCYNDKASFGYSITAGYYLYWKRLKDS